MSMMASTAATAGSESQRQSSDEHRPSRNPAWGIRDVQHRQAVQDDPNEDRANHVGAALVKHANPISDAATPSSSSEGPAKTSPRPTRAATKTPPSAASTPEMT
jgi:hypothetical protein